jgi:hypothetical protein
MNQYKITASIEGVPTETIYIKWANDEKKAQRLCLHKNPDRDGTCIFKRGAVGRIKKVEKL